MDPAISLNLNTTLGAIQIGVLVSYVLFGVSTTQTYIYYSRFPDDSRKPQGFGICEVGHALCIGHSLYVYTISDYAHPERVLGPTPKSLETTSIFFPASSRHAVMSVLRLLGCIALFVAGLGMKSANGYVMQWEWLDSFVWSISTTNDVMITTTLVILLRNQRENVHMRDWILTSCPSAISIAHWSVYGLFCAFRLNPCNLNLSLSFVAMKENFIWVAFWVVGARGQHSALNEVTVPSLFAILDAGDTKVALPSHSVQITKVTRIASNAEPSHVQSDKFLPEDV
ncbi:hypothetical protein B0H13DRAFT_1905379 [Mycena leptocephala]|nr:hypothetical protein B0H13DRAFT_1905379 [Mycena leptocephala]